MQRRKILELFDEQKDFFNKVTNKGIENNRKGSATIIIKNKNGDIICDAKIKAEQKTHEFKFGANLFMLDELESKEKNDLYKKYFSSVFNMATLPFYWNTLEPEKGKTRYEKDSPKIYRRPAPDLCIEFCEKHNIEPREHALAYDLTFPRWLSSLSVKEEKKELERRFSEIAKRYANKIPTIEVTNEMEREKGVSSFYDEPDFIEWCFKTAEKYFPNNQLAINEYNALAWDDYGRTTDKYYAYIENTLLKGARIDAIGFQYHLFYPKEKEYELSRKTLNPKHIYHQLDLYSNFKKPLQLTEVTLPAYSANKEDEEIQAILLEKLYTLWFSHPSVEQIIYWNLVDGYLHVWEQDPKKIRATMGDMTIGENYYYGGLLHFDLTPKPAFLKLEELINKKWHTNEEIITNKNGVAYFRGFYGEYSLDIEVNGNKTKKTIKISKNSDNEITVIL